MSCCILEDHLGEGVPSQRIMVVRQIFCNCNSPHDDEFFATSSFAHLYFNGVDRKHGGILSDRDIRGQLEPWRLFITMIFN